MFMKPYCVSKVLPRNWSILKVCLILQLTALCVLARPQAALTVARPEDSGIYTDSLKNINMLMQAYVDSNKLSGIVTMIARKGCVVSVKAFGRMTNDKPMRADAIFRIASMTKPITSLAVMILYDEGRFKLDDPVSMYLPEFKHTKVFKDKDKDSIYVEEPEKPITIRRLLTHTSGLGSGYEDSVIDSLYRAAGIGNADLKGKVEILAGIPLKYQPGTIWNYGYSTDVLGRLVEVLSGHKLDEFFAQRIFKPLNMNDIGFAVPAEKLERVPSVYCPSKQGIDAINDPEINDVAEPAKYIAGNGGLLSTAADYMIFSQMILNRGIYNGTRILKPETVDMMISNQLTGEKLPEEGLLGTIMAGMGYGLGFCIVKEESKEITAGSAGSYWWSGSANTYFFIDPKEELAMLLMTQFVPNYYYPVFKEFRELVYRSIIK